MRYAYLKNCMAVVPSALVNSQQIRTAVSEVEKSLAPDVVHIRFDVGEDWSGDGAIFFRILVSDEASQNRLRKVTAEAVRRLGERLDSLDMDLFRYHNVRSVSEQAELREAAWD